MSEHSAVLVAEVIAGLAINPGGIYIDATFGRGGHSRAILAKLGQSGRLLALDRDPDAVAAAQKFADPRFTIVQARFATLQQVAQQQGVVGSVAGILLDIGVSSPQLDNAKRGFSFNQAGPLDMRMDPTQGESAAAWLARVDETTLADSLYRYGEERYSRRIAKAIIQARSEAAITTTDQLAAIIARAHPQWEAHKHPATRSFQALRIVINDELNELMLCLQQGNTVLKQGGRLVVISFHSLEDRLVKQFAQQVAVSPKLPRNLPLTRQQLASFAPNICQIGKAIRASRAEIDLNPRSRSAVLRMMEKVG